MAWEIRYEVFLRELPEVSKYTPKYLTSLDKGTGGPIGPSPVQDSHTQEGEEVLDE